MRLRLRKHSQAERTRTVRIHGWIPILIMIGLGAGFGAFNILLSSLLGPRKPTPGEARTLRVRHAAGR